MEETGENVDINYYKISETASVSNHSSATETYVQRRQKMYSRYVPNKRLSRYKNSLKSLLPFRKTSQETLSIEYSGIFSQITFFWMWKYILDIRRSFQNESIVPMCPQSDSCMANAQRLDGKWSEIAVKQGNKSGSMLYVAWLFIRTRIIVATIIYSVGMIISIGGLTLLLPEILNNIKNNNTGNGFTLIILLGVVQFLACLCISWSNAINLRTALRLRIACLSNIYRRVMSTSIFYDITVNQIVSFMVPNGKFIEDMVLHMPQLIASPIILVGCAVTFSIYLHPLILICFATLLLVHVILYMLISLYSEYNYNKAFEASNQRFDILEELISNVFNIKIFLNERFFKNDINKTRKDEVNFIKSSQFIENICSIVVQLIPIFSIVPLFLYIYSEFEEGKMEPHSGIDDPTLTILTTFSILLIYVKLAVENFSTGISALSKGNIALKMLKGIMRLESVSTLLFKPTNTDVAISITNGEFMHAPSQNKGVIMSFFKKCSTLKMKQPQLICLREIDISIDKGQVIGICGQSGSGKTSLLHAILGHLKECKAGTHKTLRTDGQFAYVAEEPFIFDGSIKDNILFGHDIDNQKYMRVLQSSGLTEELSNLNENDGTIISKSSISLSFSQRISLARAIYANKDIYLFDRFLSGVEMQFSNKIFESSVLQCLKGKTIILVTDKPSFLTKCNYVYMLYNGTIIDMGTHEQLMKKSENYVEFVSICNERNSKVNALEERFGTMRSVKDESSIRKKSLASLASMSSVDALDSFSDPLTSDVTVVYNLNDIDSDVELQGNYLYKTYFESFGIFGQGLYGVFNLLEAICVVAIPYFFISNLRTFVKGDSSPRWLELIDLIFSIILITICICIIACGLISNIYFQSKIFQPAVKFHNEWIEKLCNATIHYFQTTKLATILSTMSFSLHSCDLEIPQLIRKLVLIVFSIVATVTVIGLVAYKVLLTIILISSLYITFVAVIMYAFSRYNWHEVESRNDIFTQVISTVSGRATIQAYNKQNEFTNSFYEKCENNMVYLFLSRGVKYWMLFSLNSFSVLLLIVVGCNVIFFGDEIGYIEAALVIACTILYGDLMTRFAELLTEILCSFQTLSFMDNFKQEIETEIADTKNYIQLEESWPEIDKCSISFRSLSASLMNDNFFEIVNLSFSVKSGETIGIFGLSSSGRQTFTSSLFRLIPISTGKIVLGGYDIVQIPLEKLRSLISYVPHEPVLFNKSIKSYLDPASELKESDIVDALKKVELYEVISFLPDGLESLPNDNLNMGEKQLLCLARAYLRQAKIILIEQNASNIGTATTSSLETSLKSLFKNSTVIILAEHLHSLVNCNKVMIIENGVLIEMDSPKKLYQNAKSRFSIVLKTYEETSM